MNNYGKLLLFLALLLGLTITTMSALGANIPVNMTSNVAPAPFRVFAVGGADLPSCWKAFDGNDSTPTVGECQISLSASTNFIAVDLGKNYTLQNYTLYSNWTVASGLGTDRWTIEGSTDNTTWIGLSWNGTTNAWTTKRTYPLNGNTYRYLRITNMTTSNDHVVQTLSFGVEEIDPSIRLTLSITDVVTGAQISGFCINATGTNTTQHLCNTTGNFVRFNTTGTYNITWFNITAGAATPIYFNTTFRNYIFNATIELTNTSMQAILNLSAYRKFLNTSIASFNATNNLYTNSSLPGVLAAVNGSNNILVRVLGNYTLNVTCIVPSYFSTTSCNATGVYDSTINLTARDPAGSPLTNFSYALNNTILGGLLEQQTVADMAIIGVIRGYNYSLNVTKQGYESNSTNATANGASIGINATLQPLTIYLSFRDELNRSLIGTNVTFSVINTSGVPTLYSTINGTAIITGEILPGEYTIRYGATGYSLRDYYFVFNQTVANVTLYLIANEFFTPGVVVVVDWTGLPIPGAQVILTRYYGDPDIPSVVQMATTNEDGQTLMTAEIITSTYTWEVLYNGETRVLTTIPEILYADSDGLWHKTFTLDPEQTDTVSQYAGFVVTFAPSPTPLTNQTQYNFTVNASTTYWNITSCTYALINLSNGATISSTSGFCSAQGGIGSILFTTPNASIQIKGILTLTTSDFTNVYEITYQVVMYSVTPFTLKDFLDDISNFDKAGFGGFGRFFLSVMLICVAVWNISAKTPLVNSADETVILIFLLTLPLSYIGWLTINLESMPNDGIRQWFVSIMIGLAALALAFRKWEVSK